VQFDFKIGKQATPESVPIIFADLKLENTQAII
jgi:hypothetical protein